MNIDFSKPVPVPTLAKLVGIDPVLLHGKARRAGHGLIDVKAPRRGGRYSWVTGESAAIFLAESKALQGALLQRPLAKYLESPSRK